MAKIYVRRIMEGIMTFEEVPDRWKEQVRFLLEQMNN